MDIFSRTFSIINGLVSALTLPGLLVLCLVGLTAVVLALMSPRGRMIFFVIVVLCYAISMSGSKDDETGRVPLPGFMFSVAYALKWILLIPLILYGLIASITGRGTSIITTFAIFTVCLYIFVRAVASGSWDRYFLWIFMMLGLPGFGAQIAKELGVSNIFKYLFFLGYCVIFLAILQLALRHGTELRGYRYTGFMPNPNSMGAFLSCLIVPGLWVFFECSRTRLVVIILAVLAIMLIATGSRASACQVLPVAILIAMRYTKRPLMWISFMLMGTVILVSSTWFLSDQITARFFSTSTSGRTDLWREYWTIGMETPFFGRGMGWIDEMNMYPPHNGFVFLFVESGLTGMILMGLVLLFVIFRNPARKYYYMFPRQLLMRRFIFAQLIGFLISGFFESWFIGIGYFELILFLFTIGIKDAVDREVNTLGHAYWDNSVFAMPAYDFGAVQTV